MVWKSQKQIDNEQKQRIKELEMFVEQVAKWDKDYSSTFLKMRAKEILKQ